jgi:hypothetical protein
MVKNLLSRFIFHYENKRKWKWAKKRLKKMLNCIYRDPYIAGIGSHLQIVATKEN